MNNPMTYIQNGDYQIPDLKLSQQPEKPLGKYGRMRKTYLKEHRPILYNQMLLSEKLYPHLIEIDETAQSRLEQMMPQLAKEAGATEELKASDSMKWVGLMNTCKAQAEEILTFIFHTEVFGYGTVHHTYLVGKSASCTIKVYGIQFTCFQLR